MEKDKLIKYQQTTDYIHRVIGGAHVLISVGANIADFNGYIQVNESAAFLWDELKEPKTSEELVIELVKEFDVSYEEAQKDVQGFLAELAEHKMIRSGS